ncbi:hypothetical protein CDAR_214331 [Caerostris darwini]|uniref:Uncharacterized protein n=1 Tax=Caerostris darwini TaxID=1538125 RepID=A0AAV4S803_9ARAC|nr:hypothetical protein CDAR_214331 [Caerostris darwini]
MCKLYSYSGNDERFATEDQPERQAEEQYSHFPVLHEQKKLFQIDQDLVRFEPKICELFSGSFGIAKNSNNPSLNDSTFA